MTLNELIESLMLLKADGIDGDRIVVIDVEKSDENMPHAVLRRGAILVGAKDGTAFIRC